MSVGQFSLACTLPATNVVPDKIRWHPEKKAVFQPSIVRCYVSFREGSVFFFLFGGADGRACLKILD